MDSRKVGALIAELRKEKGLTQAELAEKLNISNRTVSKWENGDGYPDITILFDLANVLGVTVDELLKGETQIVDEEKEDFSFRFTDNRKTIVKQTRLIQSKKKPVGVIVSVYLLSCAILFALVNTLTVNGQPIYMAVKRFYDIIIILLIIFILFIIFNPYIVYLLNRLQYKGKEFESCVTIKNDTIVSNTGFKTVSMNLNDLTEFIMDDYMYVLLFGKRVSISVKKDCIEDKEVFESYIKQYAKTVLYPKNKLKYKLIVAYCLTMTVALFAVTCVKIYVSNDNYFYRNIPEKTAYYYENKETFNSALEETNEFYSANKERINAEIAEEDFADYYEKDFKFKLYKIEFVNFFPNAITFEPENEGGYSSGYVHYNKEGLPKASDLGYDSESYDGLEEKYSEKDNLYLYGKKKNGTLTKDIWYLIAPLGDNWYYFEMH